MSSATQERRPQTQTRDPSSLLSELLDRPVSERSWAIGKALDGRIDKIEEMLPDFMKGQGARLAKRAQMYFAARANELNGCPPDVFIRCVLEAAELGFAIDGKLCYVVKYKSAFQLQFDYKALVAAAKRMGTIIDIYADVVYDADTFQANRKDGQSHLFHEWQMGQPRGEAIGAYAVVRLKNGEWRYELMDLDELEKIRNRAPAKNGPWATDTNEMRRKTIVRRTLKMYTDDPAVQRILEITDEELDPDSDTVTAYEPRQKVRPSKLNSQPPGLNPGETMDAGGQIHDTDETSQLDPLEAIEQEFAACDAKTSATILCDRYCHPDAVNQLSGEQRTRIEQMRDAAMKRIDASRGANSNKK